MNRQNPFASNGFFKPASSLLGSSDKFTNATRQRSVSLDDSDTEAQRHTPKPPPTMTGPFAVPTLDTNKHTSSLTAGPSIPLRDASRSPSPFARVKIPAQSEDDEEYELRNISQATGLVAKDNIAGDRSSAQRIFQKGGIGQFLFGTAVGWRVYIVLLVFWVGGCQFGTLLMNRFILWTGTYKFPYPLTLTLLQLCITHVFLLGFAALTRGLAGPLRSIGLGAIVAPSQAYNKGNRPTRYTGGLKTRSVLTNISHWFLHGSGGIAGGGLFEYQRNTAKHVFPIAVVFLGKTVLSNISFAYAVMPMYMISRITVIPLTLILTAILLRQQHSIQSVSAAMIATLNLLMTSIRSGERDPWESVAAGVSSSLFVALYPILLLRGYRQLVSDLVPQGTKEETRAYWRALHYTSSLTIAMLIPFVIISGELKQINRNCYFLDVPWFWFLMSCASLGGFGIFCSFLLLVKATSPLSANFVSLPRSVFQITVLSKFKMPAHSWVGAGLCILSCMWYCLARARDGRGRSGFAA
ncbi:hypothetical protein E4T44_02880 [Aureobasidium sp. EXF-8845]|nr:hypothetical protein E4T44_02880 [Aureobasidium sp. EXF-8845]KAI4856431.1 hypothetical protein E4T45_02105 [Aureobasidium sp. EXF-8846]